MGTRVRPALRRRFLRLFDFAHPVTIFAPAGISRKQAQKEREGRSGFASTKGRQSLKKGFGVKLGAEDVRDKDFGSNFGGLVASAPKAAATDPEKGAARPPNREPDSKKQSISAPARGGGFGHGGRTIRKGGWAMAHPRASEGAPVLPEKMPSSFNMPKKGNPFE